MCPSIHDCSQSRVILERAHDIGFCAEVSRLMRRIRRPFACIAAVEGRQMTGLFQKVMRGQRPDRFLSLVVDGNVQGILDEMASGTEMSRGDYCDGLLALCCLVQSGQSAGETVRIVDAVPRLEERLRNLESGSAQAEEDWHARLNELKSLLNERSKLP